MQEIGRAWIYDDTIDDDICYHIGFQDGSFHIRKDETGEWEEATMVCYKGHLTLGTTDDAPYFDAKDIYWNME